MVQLTLAKRRALRRRSQDGAAMFIVSMTIAVLASLGVYALAAAATEVRSSGNERQNTQTHFLATYGVLGTAHDLTAYKAQFYLNLVINGQNDTPCMSLPGLPGTADRYSRACRFMEASPTLGTAELGQTAQGGSWVGAVTMPYNATTPMAPLVNPGSFGYTPMNGKFHVELTEPTQTGGVARFDLKQNFCFITWTASSYGLTQPIFAGNPTGVFGSEGIETQRARLVTGPVQCPR
jgi:hypothetical protein